jgi:hypothetical protein
VAWREVSDGATLRRDVPAYGGGGAAADDVIGAPTFVIHGARFDGDWRDVEQFAAVIEEAGARSELGAVR